ncbi:MAG: hypothetical protein ABR540_14990, partial [Acidimicrobiales bacterium]
MVVPVAEAGQAVEGGGAGDGPPVDMVDLEAMAHVAALYHAPGIPLLEGAALVGGDRAPGVGHGHDVDALGDHRLEDGVPGRGPGRGDGDGTHPGDLTRGAHVHPKGPVAVGPVTEVAGALDGPVTGDLVGFPRGTRLAAPLPQPGHATGAGRRQPPQHEPDNVSRMAVVPLTRRAEVGGLLGRRLGNHVVPSRA